MLRVFRRLTIIISIFILTGCSANYSLTINDTKDITEYLKVIEDDKNKFNTKDLNLLNATPKEYLETRLKWPLSVYEDSNPIEPVKINGVDYYNQNDISNDNVLGLTYSFNHDFDLFEKSKILNKCYSYNLSSNNNIITFNTTSDFKCFDEYPILDDITFKIYTTCSIKDNNSDEKKNNELIYYIKKDNINKNISFILDCNQKKEKSASLISFELILGYLLGIGLVLLIGRIIYNSKNKI